VGETIGAKTLHAASFMVHSNQQVWTDAFDLGTQVAQLRPTLPVAAKQNQPARERMGQATAVISTQRNAFNVQNQGGMNVHGNAL
jgi:hypothetical protein